MLNVRAQHSGDAARACWKQNHLDEYSRDLIENHWLQHPLYARVCAGGRLAYNVHVTRAKT